MEKILTIGIPVYNMERYLDRCLSSVTGISNLDKVEIIVVNDGSTDSSLEIARTYEQRFPESVRVIDKPNGGWGTAINTLISQANGKYFKSLDSDDWFSTNELDRYVHLLSSIDTDLILTDYNEVDDKGNITTIVAKGISDTNVPLEIHLEVADYNTSSIHAITFRTKLLQDIGFVVEPKYYADLDFILSPLLHVINVYLTHINVYQYYYGRPGQSVSIEGYNKHFLDYIRVTQKLSSLIESAGDSKSVLRTAYAKRLYTVTVNCYRILLMNKFQGKNSESRVILKSFDRHLKQQSPYLYRLTSKKKAFGLLPYIAIWRLTGLNIFKIIRI